MYLAFLKEIKLIVLQEQLHLSTTSKTWAFSVSGDSEGTASGRAPDVLFIIVVLGDDLDSVSDKVGTVKPNTELT